MDRKTPLLICADLDGTCVRYVPRLEVDPEFVACLRSLRRQGVGWIMNSDRPVEHMTMLCSFLAAEEQPLALLARQRDILLRGEGGGYRSHCEWNAAMQEIHEELWREIAPRFPEWQAGIESRFAVSERFVDGETFAFQVPVAEQPRLREHMAGLIRPHASAKLSGNDVWSFVLHASFSKKRVLVEAARLLGVPCHRVLAIGDGLNDLSMLDGSATPLVGCPASADRAVRLAVAAAGGCVADAEYAAGAVEVVRHFFGAAAPSW